jgi:hypothetical protein
MSWRATRLLRGTLPLASSIGTSKNGVGSRHKPARPPFTVREFHTCTPSVRCPAPRPQAGTFRQGRAGSGRHPAFNRVLPFESLDVDDRAARLADGLTDQIIADLVARHPDIFVIARHSVLCYGGGLSACRMSAASWCSRMPKARDIVDPYEQIDRTKVKTQGFSERG